MTTQNTTDRSLISPKEAERQTAELSAMQRMLSTSQGCFSLSIAICNSPALRDYLIGQLQSSFHNLKVISIPPAIVDVYGFVTADISESPGDGLFITNLEVSVHSEEKHQHTLRSLNASRELWEKRYNCPIVFWLPEYTVTLLALHARDFWRYRSHSFEFVSEQAGAIAGMQDRFSGDISSAANLSAEQKRFRIAELEQRITEAGDNPSPTMNIHIAIWLNELAYLYRAIGELERAEEMLRRALEIDEKLGRLEGMAADYGNLGLIYRTRGDLDRAEEMHLHSLEIEEKLGRLDGMGAQYGNLGVIYQMRGNLNQAEEMQRRALEIHEKLGSQEGMATGYGNLGAIYITRGDLDRAEEMLRRTLEIDEKLGRQAGMAASYSNLGLIYSKRGDLDRAEEMQRRALEMAEKLGHLVGMANAYGNLGLIYRGRGDLDQAERMLRKALEINEKLGRLEGMANQYANLGLIYKQRRDFNHARKTWEKALDLYAKIGIPHMVEKMNNWLETLLPPD